MSKQTEALKLALGYMDGTLVTDHLTGYERKRYVMEAIREALAEQPAPPPECKTDAEKTAFAFGWWKALEENRKQPAQQQEPVAWILKPTMELLWPDEIEVKDPSKHRGYKPLYTSPQPSKPWVGLTNQELIDLTAIYSGAPLYCAIEAKLKEKNT